MRGQIIIDEDGARVESVQGSMTTFAEVLGSTAQMAINKAGKPDTSD